MCSFCNQNKADSLELSFSSDDLTVKTPSVNSDLSCMVGSMYLWPEIPASYQITRKAPPFRAGMDSV